MGKHMYQPREGRPEPDYDAEPAGATSKTGNGGDYVDADYTVVDN